MLIECNFSQNNDENEKINIIKHYHKEERKIKKEVVLKLKDKEQFLAKQIEEMEKDPFHF